MRYQEIIQPLSEQQQLDENWKKALAGVGLAGVAGISALGGGANRGQSYIEHPVAVTVPAAASSEPEKPSASQQSIDHAEALLRNKLAQYLKAEAKKAGIVGTELAQFLAQCAHETQNFTKLRETGNAAYFKKKYDKRYNLANAELLGNTNAGDGERYFGRGYIHLTGKYNYARAGQALGLDLVRHPELAERPENAAKIAIWFWQNRVQPRVGDFSDVAASTRPINRKLVGLDDREHKFSGLNYLIAKK